MTARRIYDIHLNADLVVFRRVHGLGAVSGDGVIGLARRSLCGDAVVVATLWDVADEPAARLMPSLYRSLKRVPDKARALRRAQLRSFATEAAASALDEIRTATLAEHPILGQLHLVGSRRGLAAVRLHGLPAWNFRRHRDQSLLVKWSAEKRRTGESKDAPAR